MPETVNILLQVPTRGSEVGTWDVPVNGDFNSIDGWLGGVASLSLSNSNVTLTAPSGTPSPGSGPTQAENGVLKLTGTLGANVVLTLPLPGKYIVKNSCVVGAFYVQARALGTGNMIGLPEGRSVTIWNDGVDVDFSDAPEVGSALDLHCNTTSLPKWMTACSVLPYLIKNGGVHTSALYPALAARLGSTYGGNGITTFGLPDELSRIRLPVDTSGSAGRVTQAISGINGTTFGSSGGDQRLQSHTHSSTLTDNGHIHGQKALAGAGGTSQSASSGGNGINANVNTETANATTGVTLTNANFGTGTAQNMPPAIVDFIPLIKTAIAIGVFGAMLNMFPGPALADRIDRVITTPKHAREFGFLRPVTVKKADALYLCGSEHGGRVVFSY